MAEIVTVKEKFDAEEVLVAVERAFAYAEALDDLDAIRACKTDPKPSPMTLVLRDAWDLVQEVRAAEREEEWEAEYPEVSQAEFDAKFGVKDV